MQAEKLYIWAEHYEDAETQIGCDALFSRQLEKCSTVLKYAGIKPSLKIQARSKSSKPPYKDAVGIYSIFHSAGGMGPMKGAMSGSEYVERVLKPMLGKDFSRVSKLVFLSCNLGLGKIELKTDIAGKSAEKVAEHNVRSTPASFLLGVMSSLNENKVQPKIVGWDSYISILPHIPILRGHEGRPDRERSIYGPTGKLKSEQIKKLSGRKFGKQGGKKFRVTNPDLREQYKRTLWIEDGTVHVAGSAGWSLGD